MRQKRLKLSALLLLGLGLTGLQAQESINTTGGNATGDGGSASYSIGQMVYTTTTGDDGSVAQGVQQAFEIYVLGVEDLEEIKHSHEELQAKVQLFKKIAYNSNVDNSLNSCRKLFNQLGIYFVELEAISNSKVREKPIIIKEESAEVYISPEVTALILKNLAKFENSKKFLEKDITTGRLAEILRTNSKYISQVIRTHRGGKPPFIYISDLKIDYLVLSLQREKTYRNYTNKALAELLGFGCTQNFTIAFKVRIEISPTFFIKKIRDANTPKN